MDTLTSVLPLPPLPLLAVCLGVLLAYVVFGIAGFGTALVAGPVLAQFVPVATIVPLLALLDCAAASVSVARDGKAADTAELRRIVPAMVLGSLGGAAMLLLGPPRVLLLALGLFAVGYAVYVLSGFKPDARFSPRAARPFGLVGGVFSALFGSGGFIYAIYLAGRIENNERMRVTQSALIGLSTLTRAVLFLLAGVRPPGHPGSGGAAGARDAGRHGRRAAHHAGAVTRAVSAHRQCGGAVRRGGLDRAVWGQPVILAAASRNPACYAIAASNAAVSS